VPLVSPSPNNSLVEILENKKQKYQSSSPLEFTQLMPNPALDNIFAKINSAKEMEVNLQILDARGKLMQTKQIKLNKGNNTIEINISDLPVGMYFLFTPELTGQEKGKRFMKVRG